MVAGSESLLTTKHHEQNKGLQKPTVSGLLAAYKLLRRWAAGILVVHLCAESRADPLADHQTREPCKEQGTLRLGKTKCSQVQLRGGTPGVNESHREQKEFHDDEGLSHHLERTSGMQLPCLSWTPNAVNMSYVLTY